MRMALMIASVALLSLGAALMGTGVLAQGGGPNSRTVMTVGNENFVPNAHIAATLHFSPGNIVIRSGGTLTLTHGDQTDEPHTLSIVDAGEVPTSIDQVFECGAPGTVCDDVFSLIGFPPAPFTNAPGSQPGLDARLDTLVVFPGESASTTVSAPPGSVLHFICAIHPWMQGKIDVN